MTKKKKKTQQRSHQGKRTSTSKALAQIAQRTLNARKPDLVWTHADFERELESAQRTGPENMSDDQLMSFCHGVTGYYGGRFLVDARPFFAELWQRINVGKLRVSKTEACRQIGCSRQWANSIVSGRADERREIRKKAKQAKGGNLVSTSDESAGLLTRDEYVHQISKTAFAILKPVLESDWDLYDEICDELSKQFAEARKTPPVAKALAAGAS